jgi:hypothetical protein
VGGGVVRSFRIDYGPDVEPVIEELMIAIEASPEISERLDA